MLYLDTVLKAIAAVGSNIPEFLDLIEEAKSMFNEDAVTAIDEALAASTKRADDQHEEAQNL